MKTKSSKALPSHSDWHLTFDLLGDVRSKVGCQFLSQARISKSPAGTEIIGQLGAADEVHFLISGLCRAVFYSQNGIEVGFRQISAGQYFGELGVLTDRPRVSAVVAETEVVTARLSKADFIGLLLCQPEVALKVAGNLASLVQVQTSRVIEFNTLNVKQRIWIEVARMARGGKSMLGGPIELAMPTHEQIASNVGVNREAVTRELRVMKQVGLIDYDRRYLKILNMAALLAEAMKADLFDFTQMQL
jgi:CRP/FNR family transcriptional regulator, cyclic AMP receptor protein